jgi:hypothetical protein
MENVLGLTFPRMIHNFSPLLKRPCRLRDETHPEFLVVIHGAGYIA